MQPLFAVRITLMESVLSKELDPIEGVSLNEKDRSRLIEIASDLDRLQKHDTEAAFAVGQCFKDAVDLIGNAKICRTWLKEKFNYTDRHIRNYRSVAANLAGYKERCIAVRIPVTVLFKIAQAKDKEIQLVLARFESGHKPSVKDVSDLLENERRKDNSHPEVAIDDVPGTPGFKKLAALEASKRAKRLRDLLLSILSETIAADSQLKQRGTFLKGQFAASIDLYTEEAVETLLASIGTFQRNLRAGKAKGSLNLALPDDDAGWAGVVSALKNLRKIREMRSDAVSNLIRDKILPRLQWALELTDAEIGEMYSEAIARNCHLETAERRKAGKRKAATSGAGFAAPGSRRKRTAKNTNRERTSPPGNTGASSITSDSPASQNKSRLGANRGSRRP